MRSAISLIIDDLRRLGVKEVAAIPKRFYRKQVDASEVWNGPERLFEDLGFCRVREEEAFSEVRLEL